MQQPSADTIQSVWTWSLIVFTVVLVVVAVLLTLILRAARDITAGVSAIWNVGQRIANNTIHLALLEKTNAGAAAILGSAVGVVKATAAVEAHAGDCPGCPACVLGPRWKR
jgi:K+ transporter